MERVGEHAVPVGPLAVRWLAHAVDQPRAGRVGRAVVRLENAGTATWRSRGEAGVQVAYHWLDDRGNPIVWDGARTAFPRSVAPGEQVEVELRLLAPQPPGRYRLAFDLVEEFRFWFAEVGSLPLTLDVDVRPPIDARRLAVVVAPGPGDEAETRAAIAAQDEAIVSEEPAATAHLVAGCLPAPDWSRRLLDAHEEGFAAVGGSVEALGGLRERGARARLAAWAPDGGGRNPAFSKPLLFPSLVAGLEPGEHDGYPAFTPREEPWLYDARIGLRLRLRPGRPPA